MAESTVSEQDTGGCPVVHTDYRLPRPVHTQWEMLNADRESGAVLRADFTPVPFWMLTRYDQVLEALQMPEVFGNEVINAMDPRPGLQLLPQHLNPPHHAHMRRALNRWFSPAAVRRIEPTVVRRCGEMIDEMVAFGECDLVADFAIRFPTEMFLVSLGLPLEDGDMFLGWVEKIFAGFFGGDSRAMQDSRAAMLAYFDAAADERMAHPRDPETDFLTRLLSTEVEGETLTRQDLLTICFTLMVAGLDTTRSALGYIFHHLATHPDERRAIVADPSLTPKAIEEFVRLYTLVIQDGRLVKEDVEFHGAAMKKGDVLWLGLASANRDPRQFERPDDFVLGRPNGNQHLGFGAGPHRCLGMHLARHELVIAVNEFHKRIPDYELATDRTLMERGGQPSLMTLPLRWRV